MIKRILLPFFAAFILVFSAGAYPLYAEGRGRMMGTEMTFFGAGPDFIVANEKTFMITPKTKILDKSGQKMSLTGLSQGAKIHIEYEAHPDKVPAAVIIKVISKTQ